MLKRTRCACIALLITLSLSACHPAASAIAPESQDIALRTVVDSYGRTVELPQEIKTIACTGSGALRIVSYLQCTDRVIGVEDTDKEFAESTLRDYAHAYHATFAPLPSIGKGGGTGNTAYVEELITLQPDVILSGYNEEALAELAEATGIPCVSIRYQSINFVDTSFYRAMEVAAEVLDAQERCAEVLAFIDDCKADLKARTDSIPDAEKPLVYAGAITFSGAHGFTGTYANFGPLMGIGARNAADETGETGYFDVDPEKIIEWDPDIIFLDPGNMELVKDEYRKNPSLFHSLRAVRDGDIYAMVSFNNYSTNVGYALSNAYYGGTVLFPDQFADVRIDHMTDNILEFLLGSRYYARMEEEGLAFEVMQIAD